jgi:hypothetical protein
MIEQNVLGLNTAEFFVHIFELWKNKTNIPFNCFSRNGSSLLGNCSSVFTTNHQGRAGHKVVAKLDIEGAEYKVLPDLVAKNALCYLDSIMIEYHPPFD